MKLRQLEQLNFDPSNCFVIGYSFGAHVALQGSFLYGAKKVARLDILDPAGPGFDFTQSTSIKNASESAQCVQCMHTSNNMGTVLRYCPFDININCAVRAYIPPFSHIDVTQFYNDTLSDPKAHQLLKSKPIACTSQKNTPILTDPDYMGFWFNNR